MSKISALSIILKDLEEMIVGTRQLLAFMPEWKDDIVPRLIAGLSEAARALEEVNTPAT